MKTTGIDQLTENPMTSDAPNGPHRAGSHEILANRLLQLANDTDRVGLHREAIALASFAASVLDGRIDIRDA